MPSDPDPDFGSPCNECLREVCTYYDLSEGVEQPLPPIQLDSAIIENNAPGEATDSQTFEKTVETESNYAHTIGASLTGGMSFKAKVPLIADDIDSYIHDCTA